jgi:porphobilinogen synthase
MKTTPVNESVSFDMPTRPRRTRRGAVMRSLVRDVDLSLSSIVMPLFLKNGTGIQSEVSSMPGVFQMSPDVALEAVQSLGERGIKSFMMFGVVDSNEKDPSGAMAFAKESPVAQLLALTKRHHVDACMIADLCFCEYTSHGHCGVLCEDHSITVDNDQTLEALARQAVHLVESGASMIAPSGAMDGMVSAIRSGLDSSGFEATPIMSYSVKYASAMYGPFRDAAQGAPSFGDRRGYQMDFRRSREWRTEIELDIAEGADIVMVKPAGAYLDVISKVRDVTELPVAAYQVSGEYSMLQAAADKGWLSLENTALESLYAIKRAGADIIISYFAPQLTEWLGRGVR